MKPCDCIDEYSEKKYLKEQGLGHNNESIEVSGGNVILTLGNVTIKIWGKRFKQFAEWYLTDQDADEQIIVADLNKCRTDGRCDPACTVDCDCDFD